MTTLYAATELLTGTAVWLGVVFGPQLAYYIHRHEHTHSAGPTRPTTPADDTEAHSTP